MSFSRLKVIVVFELPWPDVVRSSSIPSMLLTVSSIGFVIWDSTSSGLAPFKRTLILTVGDSVLGIRSTPRSRYENAPNTTSATDIMIANTGRLMHTSAIFTTDLLHVGRYPDRRLCRHGLRRDRHGRLRGLHVLHHHHRRLSF